MHWPHTKSQFPRPAGQYRWQTLTSGLHSPRYSRAGSAPRAAAQQSYAQTRCPNSQPEGQLWLQSPLQRTRRDTSSHRDLGWCWGCPSSPRSGISVGMGSDSRTVMPGESPSPSSCWHCPQDSQGQDSAGLLDTYPHPPGATKLPKEPVEWWQGWDLDHKHPSLGLGVPQPPVACSQEPGGAEQPE